MSKVNLQGQDFVAIAVQQRKDLAAAYNYRSDSTGTKAIPYTPVDQANLLIAYWKEQIASAGVPWNDYISKEPWTSWFSINSDDNDGRYLYLEPTEKLWDLITRTAISLTAYDIVPGTWTLIGESIGEAASDVLGVGLEIGKWAILLAVVIGVGFVYVKERA